MTTAHVLTRDTLLQHAQSLPAAPQVLGGLCELLEDVNADLDQISNEIRIDAALAARVIRLSNSVVFGGGSRVGAIEEAVNRVGFAEIVRLVGVATVGGLVDRSLAAYGIEAAQLRKSLLFHALAAEALAGHTAIGPRSAYAAGLVRGIGMMVLDRAVRGWPGAKESFDPSQFTNYHEWEQARFGVAASEVSTMILDEWRFPAEVVAAIEHHMLAPGDDTFAGVLNLAGAIVAAHEFALPGEEQCWMVTPARLRAAGLSEAQWHAAGAQAHAAFEAQRTLL